MTAWSDPETFWLNVTNAALGLVVLAAAAALVASLGVELFERARRRAAAFDDPHTYLVPELGTTVADGGEKIQEEKKSDEKRRA